MRTLGADTFTAYYNGVEYSSPSHSKCSKYMYDPNALGDGHPGSSKMIG